MRSLSGGRASGLRIFGYGVLLLLTACGEARSFSELTGVESASISGVNLNITARQELVADSLAMQQLATLVTDIARGLQDGMTGPTGETEFVQLQLGYASADRLGNEGTVDFGTIRFPISDLRAAKLDNLRGTQVLELADHVSPSAGIDTAINYCAEYENVMINPEWCTVVAEGLGIEIGS